MPETEEQKQVEGRTEYRVVGENFRGEPYETGAPFRDLDTAMANLRGWKAGGALSGRIEQRTITTGPWEDVNDA